MRVVKGDLIQLALQQRFDVIVHGCNCFNNMGGGIARQLAIRWPEVAVVDRDTNMGDRNKLGTFTIAETPVCKVVNAYTQYHYGQATGPHFDYAAFGLVLENLAKRFSPETKFGFPLIGCGLAGGDEIRILRMIKEWSTFRDVTVVRFD
jgi:O-acetyl-ADP-ribose deacetylase (regulator of RNase III)